MKIRIPDDRFLWLVWGYLVEPLAAALLTALTLVFQGTEATGKELASSLSFWTAASFAGAASCVAIWAVFLGFLSTPFGQALRKHRVAATYTSAFAYPTMVFLVTALMASIWTATSSLWLSIALLFLISYSLINSVTLIRNIVGLIRVWETWDGDR